MRKLVYFYSNGEIKEHTRFISEKTMRKEGQNSERIYIYKCTDYELEDILHAKMKGEYLIKGEYLMTLLLK